MRAKAAVFALVLAAPAQAAVEVRADAQGRVSVRADAPAAEVLDRLASQTGMKVVYEGGAPRTRVSVAFEQRTPAEAVLLVLQGLGYDYLLRFDRSGRRPELLIVSGPSNAARGTPALAAPPSAGRPVPVEPDFDEEEELDAEGEEAQEIPAVRVPDLRHRAQPTPAPSVQPAFGARPGSNYPVSPFAPAAPAPPSIVTPPAPAPEGEEAPSDNPNT
jgi:hypothetical protein